MNSGGTEDMLKATANGAVELYYDNSKKFETASYGVSTDGLLNFNGTGDKILIADNGKISFGGGGDLDIYHTGTFNLIHASNGYLQSRASAHYINNESNSVNFIRCENVSSNNLVSLHFNGVKKFETTAAGTTTSGSMIVDGDIDPYSNNNNDLGSSANRWANVYTNDLHLSNEGSSNDVDSTWGDWTIQEGESDLFLKNNRSGKKYKFNLTEVL